MTPMDAVIITPDDIAEAVRRDPNWKSPGLDGLHHYWLKGFVLKDRVQYNRVPALIEGNLVQTFIDGIRDLEVRAAVRLGHHETLKDALVHALEVEAVRQDHRSHRVGEVAAATVRDHNKGYSPRCYGCGERGHLRSSCPKRTVEREVDRSREGSAANGTAWRWQDRRSPRARKVAAVTVRDHNKGYSPRCYGCGERGYLRSSCPKRTLEREGERSQKGSAANITAQQ
ncbi:unnamed protein product [Parnassius apollo]|uniref:(apollo) hypothetical protein n=1 Tax=Parnassius apollo TaxID=110799 RepID=A0A8S3XI08_PARAO|nr:unnamed protein product [Parnassius apollo]